MTKQEAIKDLAEEIYKKVTKPADIVSACVTNRLIGSDFVKIFKYANIDYSADCMLVERIFPKSLCEEKTVEVIKYPQEAMEIKEQISELIVKASKYKNKKKIKEIAEEIENLKIKFNSYQAEASDENVLVTKPFNDGVEAFMLEINEKTKLMYRSFCYQIANFVYEYFLTLRMASFEQLHFEVLSISGIGYVDIVCRLR